MRIEVEEVHVELAIEQACCFPPVVKQRAEVGDANLTLGNPVAEVRKGTIKFERVGHHKEVRIRMASHQAGDVSDAGERETRLACLSSRWGLRPGGRDTNVSR